MTVDPVEMHLQNPTQRVRPARRMVQDQQAMEQTQATDLVPAAIDEAFADLTDISARVDQPSSQPIDERKDAGELIRRNQALVANMVSQLESLDRQRKQLAELLDAVEIDPSE